MNRGIGSRHHVDNYFADVLLAAEVLICGVRFGERENLVDNRFNFMQLDYAVHALEQFDATDVDAANRLRVHQGMGHVWFALFEQADQRHGSTDSCGLQRSTQRSRTAKSDKAVTGRVSFRG